ncbi:hypothetical protein GCM10009530_48520 [Microbispora corallina]|uniref:Secreted protein n=1 Tax=Microbispora corallina TaxID=83302 RepID=A0ABQ4G5S5_9ACTN|nr:hypothetical protein Mco01_54280 [Microbispora corallina]
MLLRRLILIIGVTVVSASPAVAAEAWADGLSALPSARAVVPAPPAGQAPGTCGPGSPCAAVDCGPGRVCVPSPKQCFTTPCPQYDCVPASSVPRSDHRPPYPGSHPGQWRPRRPEQRPAYPQHWQTADHSESSPVSTPADSAANAGRVIDLQP